MAKGAHQLCQTLQRTYNSLNHKANLKRRFVKYIIENAYTYEIIWEKMIQACNVEENT